MLKITKKLQKKEISDFNFEEVLELQKILKYHSDLYYNKENPEISDKEYDDLLKKLEILENNFSNIFTEKNIKKQSNKI